MTNVNWAVHKYYKERNNYKLLSIKIRDLLEVLLKNNEVHFHEISSREKDHEKLREKILRKGKSYKNPLEDITDLAGVRVIAYFPSDIDRIVKIIKNEFNIDKDNTVDKRYSSDPNVLGYASVHVVVSFSDERLKLPDYVMFHKMKCEIQVRTILQHSWAEIDHGMVYESIDEIPFQLQRRFATLAGMLEIADREFESIRQYEKNIKKLIQKSLLKGNLNIQINFDSITKYLEVFHKEKDFKNHRVGMLNKLLRQKSINTIEEFNNILFSEMLEAIDTALKDNITTCSPETIKQCLLRYFIALSIHFNIEIDIIDPLVSCNIFETMKNKSLTNFNVYRDSIHLTLPPLA